MKIQYYDDTDSLYIRLNDALIHEGREVFPGIVLDFTETGKVVGIGIDNASEKADLNRLALDGAPFKEVIGA